MKRKNEGITLIALIITVIVLIILAGVTINMVVGDNGIINKAKEAKESSKRGEAEEEIYLYWGEGEIDYEDTIEEKVEKLKEKMQEKDIDATASIGENEIEIKYKGYDFKIPYKDKETSEEITFIVSEDVQNSKPVYMYITKSGKLYITDNETNKICINDKYPELSNETNLSYYGYSGNGDTYTYRFYTNKKALELVIKQDLFKLDNYELNELLNIETIENGKYKDFNIRQATNMSQMNGILLNDGKLYIITEDNKLQEQNLLEGVKIENFFSVILDKNGEPIMTILGENGIMYSGEENLNNTYANAFFSDKKIKYNSFIQIKETNNSGIVYNVFITDDGKAYISDIKTEQVECLNDKVGILKNKKITNIYTFGNTGYNQVYTIINTSDGDVYYTEDLKEYQQLNENNLPELTVRYS